MNPLYELNQDQVLITATKIAIPYWLWHDVGAPRFMTKCGHYDNDLFLFPSGERNPASRKVGRTNAKRRVYLSVSRRERLFFIEGPYRPVQETVLGLQAIILKAAVRKV